MKDYGPRVPSRDRARHEKIFDARRAANAREEAAPSNQNMVSKIKLRRRRGLRQPVEPIAEEVRRSKGGLQPGELRTRCPETDKVIDRGVNGRDRLEDGRIDTSVVRRAAVVQARAFGHEPVRRTKEPGQRD